MAFVIADRVRETTTTIGTGSVTLGGAYTSFQTFSAAIGNGNNTYYTIASASSGEWEVGIGTYASGGNLLSRDTVLASSNAGNLVNFSVGSKDVFVTQPSERSLLINSGSTGLFAGNAAFTANGIPYANSTTTLTTGSALTFDGAALTNTRNTTDGSSAALTLTNSGATGSYATLNLNAGSVTYQQFADAAGNAIGTAGVMFRTTSNHPLLWGINNSEQMRLTSTGLGIGTSSPGARLEAYTASTGVGGWSYSGQFTAPNYPLFRLGATTPNKYASIGNNADGGFTFLVNGSSSAIGTEVMYLNASGNLGLGVTPSAWSNYKALQFGYSGALSNHVSLNYLRLESNSYNGGSGETYLQNGYATKYAQNNGAGIHAWYTAPSGNAGDPISFTQAMTLDASGRLLIGTTSATASGGFLQIGQVPNGTSSSIGFNNNDNAVISARYSMVFQNDSDNNIGGRSFEWKKGGKGYSDGTSLMTLDASGNLGIGTSSPASGYLLTVGSGTASTNGTVALNGGSDSNYGSGIAFRRAGVSKGFIGTQSWVTSGTSDDITLYASASGALRFYSNGAQNAILDTSGNLGLGVTPSAWGANNPAIQIGGGNQSSFIGLNATAFGLNAYFDGTNWRYLQTGGAAALYSQAYAGGHSWRIAPSGTAGNAITFTQAMTLDASGNLGVGETSPGSYSKFVVRGGSGNFISYFGASTQTILGDNAGDKGQVGTVSNHPFIFITNATERARIDSSGNFGIAAQKVFGSGNGYAGNTSAASSATLELWDTNGNTKLFNVWGSGNLLFGTANTERARITSGGDLLVGTTSSSGKTTVVQSANSPVIHLSNTNSSFTDGALIIYNTRATTNSTYNHFACYNGDFTGQFIVRDSGNAVNSNNSYGAVSDVKLKENIVDASPKLADLMQVKVRNYNLIGDTAKQLGVVAQELETVFPAMVEESPDRDREGNDLGTTTKSVKYSVFVPMLIKALQELKAEFDAYKATHP